MPRFISQSPEIAGQTFELPGLEISIGRLDDNSVTIAHSSVSGHHAVLRRDQESDDFNLQDLGSTNGTRVNGERITEAKLRRNDLVRIGNIQVLYDSEHEPPGRPMPKVAERINLAASASRGRPNNFGNASPVPKAGVSNKPTLWTFAFVVLTILTIAALGYFIFQTVYVPKLSPLPPVL